MGQDKTKRFCIKERPFGWLLVQLNFSLYIDEIRFTSVKPSNKHHYWTISAQGECL